MDFLASEFERLGSWPTLVSNLGNFDFVELRQQKRLQIFFQTFADGKGQIFLFEWERYCAFRNVEEEQGPRFDFATDTLPGLNTYVNQTSSWVSDIRKDNDLLELCHPNVEHFVIFSSCYITEVISAEQPKIIVQDSYVNF